MQVIHEMLRAYYAQYEEHWPSATGLDLLGYTEDHTTFVLFACHFLLLFFFFRSAFVLQGFMLFLQA